jgi:hypothetical protein
MMTTSGAFGRASQSCRLARHAWRSL